MFLLVGVKDWTGGGERAADSPDPAAPREAHGRHGRHGSGCPRSTTSTCCWSLRSTCWNPGCELCSIQCWFLLWGWPCGSFPVGMAMPFSTARQDIKQWLGFEPGSLGSAVSALTGWATTPAPSYVFMAQYIMAILHYFEIVQWQRCDQDPEVPKDEDPPWEVGMRPHQMWDALQMST